MYISSVLSKNASKCAAVRSAAYRRAATLMMCAYFTDTGSGCSWLSHKCTARAGHIASLLVINQLNAQILVL